MHIKTILERHKPSFSFEFFPPKTEKAADKLFNSIEALVPLQPSFVSVTYGAGGTSRDLTRQLVHEIHKKTGLTVIPHLTCVGSSKKEVYDILKGYADSGIENILALRGDIPVGMNEFPANAEGFTYAYKLVEFIKKEFPDLGIGVAGFPEGHPATPNRLKEMEYLALKVAAGADYICTQLFFDNNMYFDYVERCRIFGIHVPVLAGIMPIQSKKSMDRMAELAAGICFPAGLLKAINRAESEELVRNVGVQWAATQVMDLLEKESAGIHLYTLNNSRATMEIYKNLGVSSSSSLSWE